jgi:MerR family mercuric resistance operon transcriptional regulator
MQRLTIGQLAGLADVGVETVRFYERQGLIDEPPRRVSGYRQYPPEAVARIRFIRRAKKLGFSLKEIKELLALRLDPHTTCGDVRDRAEEKLADIRQKIAALDGMRAALERLTAACDGDGSVSDCPILEALEETETAMLEHKDEEDER